MKNSEILEKIDNIEKLSLAAANRSKALVKTLHHVHVELGKICVATSLEEAEKIAFDARSFMLEEIQRQLEGEKQI